MKRWIILCLFFCFFPGNAHARAVLRIGFNYPATGPYAVQGLDQYRGAMLAVEEINAAGGVLGKKLELVTADTKTSAQQAVRNAVEMIEKENVKMIFGGVSSSVAIAVGDLCQQKNIIFMGTITASNATTREHGHRHTFRVCYNAWMGAKALTSYLNMHFANKKFVYIVADYSWGWSSEASIRKLTHTRDSFRHKTILTRLGADVLELKNAVQLAMLAAPDVVVMILFGNDMTRGLTQAYEMGLKRQAAIVVPILELGMVEKAGPKVMENVVGTSDWNWQVPFRFGYPRGQKFVQTFVKRHDRYPCWGAATAYTNVYEYADAARRAGSFDPADIIQILENHSFALLKDRQTWRDFDHQCVQSVYVVKCNPEHVVLADAFKLDYFKILNRVPGDRVVQQFSQWEKARKNAGRSSRLEPLR